MAGIHELLCWHYSTTSVAAINCGSDILGAISPWLILIITREGRGSCTTREVGQDPWWLPRSCREGQDRERQGCQRPWKEVSQGRRRLQKEAGELSGGRGVLCLNWSLDPQEKDRKEFEARLTREREEFRETQTRERTLADRLVLFFNNYRGWSWKQTVS